MNYTVRFPNNSIMSKFEKELTQIPNQSIRDNIMNTVEGLGNNPFPYGEKPFKKINAPIQFYQFVAKYRIRIGNYRILYDVDISRKIVWILALRKRSENTYK